jgi:L-ascorbate metabolism protein UlaG (beta-lactamase superfamily)
MLEKFTWYKQSAYKWKGEGITVYIDPWGLKDKEEPADVVFITHAHADHFEPADIAKIRKTTTQFVAPHDVAEKLEGQVKAIKPGESRESNSRRCPPTAPSSTGFKPIPRATTGSDTS